MSTTALYILGVLIIVLGTAYRIWDYLQRRKSAQAAAAASEPETPPEPITLETINSTPDHDLVHRLYYDLIYPHVEARLKGDWNKELDTVMSLPPGARMLYAIKMCEDEVYNGGFPQLFFNSSRNFVDEAVPAYERIGAPEHARLFESAIAIAVREIPDMVKHLKAFAETRDVREFAEYRDASSLDELDEIFYRGLESEDSDALMVKYIREHPDEFVLP